MAADREKGRPPAWSEKRVLDSLRAIAALNPRAGGGLVVFIDEMGKFLEAAARDGTDVHVFQQLAELCFAERPPIARRRNTSSGLRGIRIPPLGRAARRVGEDSRPVRGSRDQHHTWRTDRFARACDPDRERRQDAAARCQGRRAAHADGYAQPRYGARELLAPAPRHRVPAWSFVAPPIRPEPAQPLCVSQFSRAGRIPGFPRPGQREGTLWTGSPVGLPADQSRAFDPRLP